MADELDDLFGSEEEEQDQQQPEPAFDGQLEEQLFDDADLEDGMEDAPPQTEVSRTFRLLLVCVWSPKVAPCQPRSLQRQISVARSI